MRYKGEVKFFSEDFYKILASQNRKCALTGRTLNPINTELEFRNPILYEGRFENENFYLLDRAVSYLARHLSEEEIINLAVEIIKYRGKDNGFKVMSCRK